MNTIFDNDIDKTSKAVTKILRQTQDGEIVWEIDPRNPSLEANEQLTGQIYKTVILDKCLRLYKYYKQKTDTYVIFNNTDKYFEGVKLQFTDYDGKPEWSFPYSNAVKDLYETIAFKTTKVDEFFDKWLSA